MASTILITPPPSLFFPVLLCFYYLDTDESYSTVYWCDHWSYSEEAFHWFWALTFYLEYHSLIFATYFPVKSTPIIGTETIRKKSNKTLLSPFDCVLQRKCTPSEQLKKVPPLLGSHSYQLHIKARCDGVNINEADIPADKKKHLVLVHIPSHSVSHSLCLTLTVTSLSQHGDVKILQRPRF